MPADGATAVPVTVAVRDAFGNPVTGTDVVLDLPDGLAVAGAGDGRAVGAAPVGLSTGTTGDATAGVVAREPGTYTVGASVAGRAMAGEVTLTFTAVPGAPEVPGAPGVPEPPAGGPAAGGVAAAAVAPTRSGPLARTGAPVAALLCASATALAGGWALRRASLRR